MCDPTVNSSILVHKFRRLLNAQVIEMERKKKESYVMEWTQHLPSSAYLCASDSLEQTPGFHSFYSTETAACSSRHFAGLDLVARQRWYHWPLWPWHNLFSLLLEYSTPLVFCLPHWASLRGNPLSRRWFSTLAAQQNHLEFSKVSVPGFLALDIVICWCPGMRWALKFC